MTGKTDNRGINNAGDEEQNIPVPTPPQGQVSAGIPEEEGTAEERAADRQERMRERERERHRSQ